MWSSRSQRRTCSGPEKTASEESPRPGPRGFPCAPLGPGPSYNDATLSVGKGRVGATLGAGAARARSFTHSVTRQVFTGPRLRARRRAGRGGRTETPRSPLSCHRWQRSHGSPRDVPRCLESPKGRGEPGDVGFNLRRGINGTCSFKRSFRDPRGGRPRGRRDRRTAVRAEVRGRRGQGLRRAGPGVGGRGAAAT